MRSFLAWLFRDVFWANIFWIGLGAAVLLAIFMIVAFFIPEETLDRWDEEDANAGADADAHAQAGATGDYGDGVAESGGSWAAGAGGLAPSLRSLGQDESGAQESFASDPDADDFDVLGWFSDD